MNREIIKVEAHNSSGQITQLDPKRFMSSRERCWPSDTEFFVITENNGSTFEAWIMD